jgi:flagellar basal-body rod protein FlgG
MIAQQRRHDTVTNNIANLNTPGYKAMTATIRAFPDMLVSAMGGSQTQTGPIGKLSVGVLAEESRLNFSQGDLVQTNRMQDLALVSDIQVPGAVFDESGKYVDEQGNVYYQPQVFFTVLSPDGQQQYTRDGSFRTAPDGTLITAEGDPVLGVNGQPLVVNGSWDNIAVGMDGTLYDKQLGQPIPGAQLMLTVVENPNMLVREGQKRFRHEGPAGGVRQIQPGDRVEIRQGFLERSNADPAQSLVDLMAALRAYEANQKVIQFYDNSLQKAVNEIGKV